MEIGNLVKKIVTNREGHSVLLFEGVIVSKKEFLWMHELTVQVVTPTALFYRGEITKQNEGSLVIIETIST